MKKNRLSVSTLFIIFVSGILGGCMGGASQNSAYYVFNASQNSGRLETNTVFDDQGLGVGPIKIPEFLKRPQIVTRQEKNLLSIAEFHRWGDSLDTQITGVLVENLSKMLNTQRISAYPWERPFAPGYQLYIDFRRFDGNTGGSVTLDAVWSLVETRDETPLLIRRSLLVESTKEDGYKAYVIALNAALERLCREVAAGLSDRLSE